MTENVYFLSLLLDQRAHETFNKGSTHMEIYMQHNTVRKYAFYFTKE